MKQLTSGQRKGVAFFGQLIAATLLCWATKMDGAQFVALQTMAFPAFIAGNVGEHFAKRGSNGSAEAPA